MTHANIVNELSKALINSPKSFDQIETEALVSGACVQSILMGNSVSLKTLTSVAKALGYEVVLQKVE